MTQQAAVKLLVIAQERRQIQLEELRSYLPEFTWNQSYRAGERKGRLLPTANKQALDSICQTGDPRVMFRGRLQFLT